MSTEHNKECLINISKYKFSLVISGLTTILKNVNNMVSVFVCRSGQIISDVDTYLSCLTNNCNVKGSKITTVSYTILPYKTRLWQTCNVPASLFTLTNTSSSRTFYSASEQHSAHVIMMSFQGAKANGIV